MFTSTTRDENEACLPRPGACLCCVPSPSITSFPTFLSLSPLTSRILLPHGLVEHKARSILDPALYSERYIEHGPPRLPNAAGRVCRHHSSGCCGSTLCILDQMFCPASACLLMMSLDEAGGVYEVGGSWCRYIPGSKLQCISRTTTYNIAVTPAPWKRPIQFPYPKIITPRPSPTLT